MRSRAISLISLIVFLSVSVSAQTKDTISGFTKDPPGASVPGVKVVSTDQRTGAVRSTTSDQTGFYQVLGLVPSAYTIEAEAEGFKTYRNKAWSCRWTKMSGRIFSWSWAALQQTVEVKGGRRPS